MPPTDKKIEKLQKLLEIANEDFATPDDLLDVSEGLLSVITYEKERVDKLIAESKDNDRTEKQEILKTLNAKEQSLKYLISELGRSYSDDNEQISNKFSKEVKRLERKIPNKVDLTELYQEIETLRAGINSFPTELTLNNEAVRDGLELLQGDERLDVSAIRGIDEMFAEVSKKGDGVIKVGVHLLRYLNDVNIEGITNGQTLIWNATLGRFEAGTASGGSKHIIKDETISLPARTNLNFTGAGVTATDNAGTDSTDITIAGGGGGISDGNKGDITVTASGATWTINTNAVVNADLAQMATKTYKGRTSALTGDPEDVPVATLKTDLALVKADVGLGNVDNTSDANKPVSTATQTALNLKEDLTNKSTNTALGTSNTLYPSQNAVKVYADAVQAFSIQRANHTGSQLASTISDFASTVLATVLSGLSVATGTAVTAADSILVAIGKLQKQNTDQDTAIALNTAKVTNATHTGEVTGATTLTVDKTAVTNKTTVTADAADYVLISDTSDSGNLKKVLASDLAGGGGGLTEAQVRVIARRYAVAL